jgi:hypothetical protein
MPDYAVPGVKREGLSTIAAGILGTLMVFAAGMALALLVARKRRRAETGAP